MHGQQPDATTPEQYLNNVPDSRNADFRRLDAWIREEAPELAPHIQSGMLAYGRYRYRYPSGREGEWCVLAVSNNKAYISLYCCAVVEGAYVAEAYRERLPKASIGKSCVRFKRLSDLDEDTVRELIRKSAASPAGAIVPSE